MIKPPTLSNEHATPLAPSFIPGPWDVICNRGKVAWEHSGNKHLRLIIKKYSSAYANAKSKPERSAIVTDIVNAIHAKGTGFVKQVKKNGQWMVVEDYFAREKVGQGLRDSLGRKYRSSNSFKIRMRKTMITQFAEHVVHCNRVVSLTISQLKSEIPRSRQKTHEEILLRFTEANSLILEAMKQDTNLRHKFLLAGSAGHAIRIDTDESMSEDSCDELPLE